MRMTSGSTITRTLPGVGCPACGDILQPGPGAPIAPTTWQDCLRRCSKCELGLSNARINPTVLFNDPRMNVPQEVGEGVIETLGLALNVRNRADKKVKFGFSTGGAAIGIVTFGGDSKKLRERSESSPARRDRPAFPKITVRLLTSGR
jgi:hypothetical protein